MSIETVELHSAQYDILMNATIENMAARKLQTYRNKLRTLFYSEGGSISILDSLINRFKNNVDSDDLKLRYLDTIMISGTVNNPTDNLSKTNIIYIKNEYSPVTKIINHTKMKNPTAEYLCQFYEDQVNKIINDGLTKYKVTHKYDESRMSYSYYGDTFSKINAKCIFHVQKVKP